MLPMELYVCDLLLVVAVQVHCSSLKLIVRYVGVVLVCFFTKCHLCGSAAHGMFSIFLSA